MGHGASSEAHQSRGTRELSEVKPRKLDLPPGGGGERGEINARGLLRQRRAQQGGAQGDEGGGGGGRKSPIILRGFLLGGGLLVRMEMDSRGRLKGVNGPTPPPPLVRAPCEKHAGSLRIDPHRYSSAINYAGGSRVGRKLAPLGHSPRCVSP